LTTHHRAVFFGYEVRKGQKRAKNLGVTTTRKIRGYFGPAKQLQHIFHTSLEIKRKNGRGRANGISVTEGRSQSETNLWASE